MVSRYFLRTFILSYSFLGLSLLGIAPAFAQANILRECDTKYRAAKVANDLAGQNWQQYLIACRTKMIEASKPAEPSTKLSSFQKNEDKIAWKECISNNPSDWIMQCDQKLQQKVYDEFNNAYKFGGILHVNSLINSCYKKIENIEDFKYCYIFDRVASVIDSKYSTLLGSKQNYFNNLNLVDERASEIFSKLSNQSIQKEIHVSNWSRSADQIIRRFSNTQMPKKIVDAIKKKYTDDTFSAIMNTLSRIRSIRRINAGGPGKIAFQLDSTGKLINSTIQESSGSSISDDLALDLIKKTKFSGRPVWISGNLIFSYEFSGPIAKTRHLKSQITRTNRKTY